ncbi:MAG: hypothetical protein JW712_14730 [Dehalococcoidales bacterium]|nr:hypothetical protein [Dehalococcoidales bacterium]
MDRLIISHYLKPKTHPFMRTGYLMAGSFNTSGINFGAMLRCQVSPDCGIIEI